MILYRAFNWLESAEKTEPGGPLFNPQIYQGSGRHDLHEKDGVLYCSVTELSCVAEDLKGFRNRAISKKYFHREHKYTVALVSYELNDQFRLLDLDDPKSLLELNSKTSEINTNNRDISRGLSLKIFDRGFDGFLWPSTLDGSWMNATLFYKRALPKIKIGKNILPLTHKNKFVIQAAQKLMIELPR